MRGPTRRSYISSAIHPDHGFYPKMVTKTQGQWSSTHANMRYASLLAAADALFFIKLELQQIQILKIVMLAFQSISGLKINLQK